MSVQVTAPLLVDALGMPLARARAWAEPLTGACTYAEIDSLNRLSAFLGQLGHETGRFRWLSELWGPTEQQLRYEPVTTLSKRLGNTQPGDGRRYAGQGAIQTTGRFNFCAVRDRLRKRLGQGVPDFEAHPVLLANPQWAALSAADYWVMRGLNRWADAQDHLTLTKRINGGTKGLGDRLMLTTQARAACLLNGVF